MCHLCVAYTFEISSAAVDKSIEVKATVKDQYGAEMTISTLSYKKANEDDKLYVAVPGNKINLVTSDLKNVDKDTTTTYIVTVGLTVTVQ